MNAELIHVSGNDEMIANVARVSYGKDASNYTDEQNDKLVNYLAKHGHTSPFRHVSLQFRLAMPIYVERQIFKHQQGVSANSISGRYVDFSDTYHRIDQFRLQSTDSKQGSGANLDFDNNRLAMDIQQEVIEVCIKAYRNMCQMGIAKEQARTILPLNLNTECIMTFSFQAFAHLCHLRLKSDTQAETRELVQMMLDEVVKDGSFAVSIKAFGLDQYIQEDV